LARRRRSGAPSALPGRSWCYDDFVWFLSLLTLPEGGEVRLEPFWLLILREVFDTGRAELLVLLPKGNGKTLVMAGLAIFHVLVTPNANCYIGAADKEQAGEMYRFASHFVESEPELEKLLLVRESTKEIRSRRDKGFLKVVASDDSKSGGRKQGWNATLALLDELHAHENDNLYVAARSGLFKRHGILVTITTAGHDEESTLGELRDGFLSIEEKGGTVTSGLVVNDRAEAVQDAAGRLTIARSKDRRSVMLEWACRDGDDLADPAIVKLANPASWVTVASIEDALNAPGFKPWHFARYRANVWTPGFEPWLPLGAWDKLPVGEIPRGARVVGAVDMARYRDCAALVLVWVPEDGHPVAHLYRVERSGGPEQPIRYATVKGWIREAAEEFDLDAVGYDPRYFDQAAEELLDEGLPMERFEQSHARICPASQDLYTAVVNCELAWDGDRTFARHVYAGIRQDIGPNEWRLVKPKKRGPAIDALIALVMAYALALEAPGPVPFLEVIR
jgi:phage terminase large subunit-like protein